MTNSSQEDIALQVLEVKEKILEQAITAISRIHKDINNSIIDGDAKTLETNIITAFDSQDQNAVSIQDAYMVAVQAKVDDLLKKQKLDLQKQVADYANETIKALTEIVRKS